MSGLAVWSGSLSALGRRLEGLFCLWIPLIFKWVSMTCCKKLKQILLHQLISVPSHPIRSSGIQNFGWWRDQGRPCICAGRTPVCDFESSKMKCSYINAHLCPQWRGKGDFYRMVVEIDPSQAGQRKETLLHPPRGCEELCELQFMKHQMLPYLDCSWRHSSPRGHVLWGATSLNHPYLMLHIVATATWTTANWTKELHLTWIVTGTSSSFTLQVLKTPPWVGIIHQAWELQGDKRFLCPSWEGVTVHQCPHLGLDAAGDSIVSAVPPVVVCFFGGWLLSEQHWLGSKASSAALFFSWNLWADTL